MEEVSSIHIVVSHAAMFERSDKLDNAYPVVECFLPGNVREAALSTGRPGTGFFSFLRCVRKKLAAGLGVFGAEGMA